MERPSIGGPNVRNDVRGRRRGKGKGGPTRWRWPNRSQCRLTYERATWNIQRLAVEHGDETHVGRTDDGLGERHTGALVRPVRARSLSEPGAGSESSRRIAQRWRRHRHYATSIPPSVERPPTGVRPFGSDRFALRRHLAVTVTTRFCAPAAQLVKTTWKQNLNLFQVFSSIIIKSFS